MSELGILSILDYVVIAITLAISAVIGIYFSLPKKRVRTAQDYMMAGRNMSYLPVVLSTVASNTSAVLMLGSSSEVYVYGSQLMLTVIGIAVGMIISAYVFLPAFFNLKMDTVYEYLEIRYGKATRLLVSIAFVIQIMLYSSIALLAPSLAMSAVTPLSTDLSIIVIGLVCTFYCTIGGLKAVLWTDVFQATLMYACVLVALIYSITEAGGLTQVISLAKAGGRIEFFNTGFDLRIRYTIWNSFLRGFCYGLAGFGVNQVEVQRLFSVGSLKRAKTSLLLSIFPTLLMLMMCYSLGLTFYAVFFGCDPVLRSDVTGIKKHSQLLPYYIVTRMSNLPGIAGLCISGIFSGSLSTISSVINSVATVTMVDFIKPCWKLSTQTKDLICTKALVMVYGLICIGFSLLFSKFGTVQEMAGTIFGLMQGPIIAVFLLGITTTRINEKGIFIGFISGVLLTGWIGFGILFSRIRPSTLPLSAGACPSTYPSFNSSTDSLGEFPSCSGRENNCTLHEPGESRYIFPLYTISYAWIAAIGLLYSIVISTAASLLFGKTRNPVNLANLPNSISQGKHPEEMVEEFKLVSDKHTETVDF